MLLLWQGKVMSDTALAKFLEIRERWDPKGLFQTIRGLSRHMKSSTGVQTSRCFEFKPRHSANACFPCRLNLGLLHETNDEKKYISMKLGSRYLGTTQGEVGTVKNMNLVRRSCAITLQKYTIQWPYITVGFYLLLTILISQLGNWRRSPKEVLSLSPLLMWPYPFYDMNGTLQNDSKVIISDSHRTFGTVAALFSWFESQGKCTYVEPLEGQVWW